MYTRLDFQNNDKVLMMVKFYLRSNLIGMRSFGSLIVMTNLCLEAVLN